MDFKPLEECEESLEEEDSQPKETKETETEAKQDSDRKGWTLSNSSSVIVTRNGILMQDLQLNYSKKQLTDIFTGNCFQELELNGHRQMESENF